MKCIKCGNEINEGTKFCNLCGTNQSMAYTQAVKSSGEIDIFQIVFSVVIGLCGIIAFYMLFSSGSSLTDLRSVGGETVAEAYYQEIGRALQAFAFVVASITVFFISKIIPKIKK